MNISTTVDHALRLMLQLAATPNQTPADLARTLDLNRTAVHRLLATLQQRGFVRRAEGAAVYSLGAAILLLADAVEPDVARIARDVMEHLSADTAETVVLFVPEAASKDPRVVAVDQVETNSHVLRVQFDVGHSVPMHQGAAAQAILAYSPAEVVEAALQHAPDPDGLRRSLAKVREFGYTSTHGELLPGVVGIAAPIVDPTGRAIASISIAVPASRADSLPQSVDSLKSAAATIQQLLAS